ncbi:hypothetical protein ACFFX1_22165 [Dactylosporangium sucinum]|uniref:Uncharacterized protein n=1 Tax=Dactylosporangium sucinum TaxID=1424081 RepID=A0A917TYY0_9ACTN|nr:hypothetical protein [Dactylosporangium sucinum]GGM45834.1 hypothetical protein GCM10007977_054440 [Dactylosporangium sucinum]
MTLHSALVLLHLMLLTYWLGADLGVFYSSRFVLRPDLSVQARTIALRIMSWLDMSPKICLVLFLPSGVSLIASHPLGKDFAGWPVAAVWVASLVWLGLLLADHWLHGNALGALVRRLDLVARCIVIVVMLGAAAYTFVNPAPFGADSDPRWLGAKVGLYAIAVACGVGIRMMLLPFGPAFGRIASGGSDPEAEATLARSMRRSIPFVLVIWACVFGAALLGVFKPGSTWTSG